MEWERDGKSWPYSEASRLLSVEGGQVHVQQIGQGPVVLLLHGSGATTHSFCGLMGVLSEHYSLVAVDLPGHGFSETMRNRRASIDNVSRWVAQVMAALGLEPEAIVGHSAGAAIAAYLSHQGMFAPKGIVSINGAFYPFPGIAGDLFPALARILFLNPFTPKLFSFSAGSVGRVERLISSTGSRLTSEQIDLYQRAFKDTDHVEGTLAMMANWDLSDMESRLAALTLPVLQIVGGRDGTIDPEAARRTDRLLRHGLLEVFPDHGHLVHEEAPEAVGATILRFLEPLICGSEAHAC